MSGILLDNGGQPIKSKFKYVPINVKNMSKSGNGLEQNAKGNELGNHSKDAGFISDDDDEVVNVYDETTGFVASSSQVDMTYESSWIRRIGLYIFVVACEVKA
ncbi:hypothetical protein Tco_0886388 [Tanacetum coccineum]